MKTLIKFKTNKLQLAMIMSMAFYADSILSFQEKESLPRIANVYQKDQAKELLGAKQFRKTSVGKSTSKDVFNFAKAHLPKAYKKDAQVVAETIIQEARKNKLDPMFLMAVIMTESSFNPEVKGLHGEIGLMQILPSTAQWLAQKHKVAGPIDLKNPRTNIRLGAAYLGSLRDSFNRVGNRYIAAYNMGPTNVKRLVQSNVEPKIYSNKVMKHYKGIYKRVNAQASNKLAAL